jgi:flagellar hook-associated protein 3 FlgL
MLSNISGQGQQFLSGLATVQAAINQAQQQVSTGLKVSVASDAPDEVSTILQLRAGIQTNAQITQNLSNVQGEVGTADQSLSTAATILDQAQTLASQGLGINQTAASRATLASQVQVLLQQLVGISQTTFEGRYVFSGDSDQSPSYQFNQSTQTATRLQVSDSTRQIADTSGQTFPVGLSANQIFDARDAQDQPAAGNVFAAVTSVSTALLANDSAGLQTAAASLQTAAAYLNQQQTFYGNAENQITAAQTVASAQNVSLQQNLLNIVGADEASSIVQLQQGTTNLQAALAAYAKVPHTSLFSVLNP